DQGGARHRHAGSSRGRWPAGRRALTAGGHLAERGPHDGGGLSSRVPLTVSVRSGPLLGAAHALALPVSPNGSDVPTVGAGSELLATLGLDATAVLKAEQAKGK